MCHCLYVCVADHYSVKAIYVSLPSAGSFESERQEQNNMTTCDSNLVPRARALSLLGGKRAWCTHCHTCQIAEPAIGTAHWPDPWVWLRQTTSWLKLLMGKV